MKTPIGHALPAWALLGVCVSALATPWWIQNGAAPDHDFLSPDVAFRVRARLDGDELHVRWLIADGYYLYRQRIQVLPESPDLVAGPVRLPPGTLLTDSYFGTQEVYHQQVETSVQLTRLDHGAHPVQVKVSYQGCAEAGLCYPTITKVLFPQETTTAPVVTPHPPRHWQLVAMLGGCLAFLVAGLRLRKGRNGQYAPP